MKYENEMFVVLKGSLFQRRDVWQGIQVPLLGCFIRCIKDKSGWNTACWNVPHNVDSKYNVSFMGYCFKETGENNSTYSSGMGSEWVKFSNHVEKFSLPFRYIKAL